MLAQDNAQEVNELLARDDKQWVDEPLSTWTRPVAGPDMARLT